MKRCSTRKMIVAVVTLASILAGRTPAHAVVLNGSLEDLNGSWVNTSVNYMALAAGSTAIAGWTVAPTTVNSIVWGKSPTGDGYSAADGVYFVDLTGFDSNSPNGAIQQNLQNLIIGQQYSFSMDSFTNGALPSVTVGTATISLTAGTPFTVGGTTWTPERGTFIATATNSLLTIANVQPGEDINFVDNIIITGTTPTPEPSSLTLWGLSAAGLLGYARRRRILAVR